MTRPLFLFALLSSSIVAHAQTTQPDTPPIPQRDAYEVPAQRVQPAYVDASKKQTLTKWQIEQAKKQAEMEKDLRDLMSAHGFTNTTMQDTILAHIQGESVARLPLRERGRRLFRGLNSPKVNDAEMSLALGGYIAAVDADRARRTLAEKILDEKIGWSKNPRLQAMLLLFGIIGESPITLSIRVFNQPPRAIPRPEDAQTQHQAVTNMETPQQAPDQ
jgi:putative heme iron utilization protein